MQISHVRVLLVVLAMAMFATFLPGASCLTPGEKTVIKDVLTDTQYACLLANAFTDDETVALVCKIDATLVPIMKQYLAAHRASAVAYARAYPHAEAPHAENSSSHDAGAAVPWRFDAVDAGFCPSRVPCDAGAGN